MPRYEFFFRKKISRKIAVFFTNKIIPFFIEVDDVLHLSVYTPENFESAKKKPVMVWIHGGGLTIGGAYEYNASSLSIFGDVVVVNISYRLHALGFAFGNWGFWDQLEGLVKKNFEKFLKI